MDFVYVIAQILNIISAILAILSFQYNTSKKILVCQVVCQLVGLLGNIILSTYTHLYMGSILIGIAMLRSVIYYWGNFRKWANNIVWVYIFSALFIGAYILLFTVFNVSLSVKNFIIESLPMVGSIIMTIGFYEKTAKKVKIIYLVGSPFWLVYNMIIISIGGIITELFSIISIIIALIKTNKYDKNI